MKTVIFAPDHVVALVTAYYTVKNGVDIAVKVCMIMQTRQRQQDNSCELTKVELYGDFSSLLQAISSLSSENHQELRVKRSD
ncbi:hypothetical protein GYMLUDRAFT_50577 [Collybiopsis luxurians FD-317 M1]|uniref:Unplaced genomic scaffold GYMLUscaffold_116, whole genome shotgun sequence n=1 Tax=Collybiopsis luxurians FD-317 M1 TaxID=944289 RepID=A0A0D0C142_9AGAR|nr:hypothetical protein GYMLUDRAFT_50577 [Collybiopsis luxurians FD-317 M1]